MFGLAKEIEIGGILNATHRSRVDSRYGFFAESSGLPHRKRMIVAAHCVGYFDIIYVLDFDVSLVRYNAALCCGVSSWIGSNTYSKVVGYSFATIIAVL